METGSLKEVIRVKYSHKGGALLSRKTGVYMRRVRHPRYVPTNRKKSTLKTHGKAAISKPVRQALAETQPADTVYGLPGSRTMST